MRKYILALLALSFVGCQAQPTAHFQSSAPSVLSAQSKAKANAPIDQKALLAILKRAYKSNFADDVDNRKALDELNKYLQSQGIDMYKTLTTRPDLRQALYPYANQMVLKEFNKKSPEDNVKPVTRAEMDQLISRLKPGDVILCGNNGSFVHSALYLGQGQIVHALASQPDRPQGFYGVVKEDLRKYTARSKRDTFVVLRPKHSSQKNLKQAFNYALSKQGATYDTLFLMQSEDRFYCTELVWQAFRHMRQGPRVIPHEEKYGWAMVTVDDFMDSPDFQTVWERNYKRPAVGRLHRY